MIFIQNIIFTITGEENCFAEEISKALATKLNINYYNNQITKKASELSNINQDIIKSVDNWNINNFVSNIFVTPVYSAFSINSLVNFEPLQQQVFMAKANALNELSKNNNCVIYCRCASYMLSIKKFNNNYNNKIINIFVYSDNNSKINNSKINNSKINNSNNTLNSKKYLKSIKKNYRQYKKYHEFYTSKNLDDRLLYDIMLNTSNISVKRAVNIIQQFFL